MGNYDQRNEKASVFFTAFENFRLALRETRGPSIVTVNFNHGYFHCWVRLEMVSKSQILSLSVTVQQNLLIPASKVEWDKRKTTLAILCSDAFRSLFRHHISEMLFFHSFGHTWGSIAINGILVDLSEAEVSKSTWMQKSSSASFFRQAFRRTIQIPPILQRRWTYSTCRKQRSQFRKEFSWFFVIFWIILKSRSFENFPKCGK